MVSAGHLPPFQVSAGECPAVPAIVMHRVPSFLRIASSDPLQLTVAAVAGAPSW